MKQFFEKTYDAYCRIENFVDNIYAISAALGLITILVVGAYARMGSDDEAEAQLATRAAALEAAEADLQSQRERSNSQAFVDDGWGDPSDETASDWGRSH